MCCTYYLYGCKVKAVLIFYSLWLPNTILVYECYFCMVIVHGLYKFRGAISIKDKFLGIPIGITQMLERLYRIQRLIVMSLSQAGSSHSSSEGFSARLGSWSFFFQLGIVFFSSKRFFSPLIFFSYFLCIFGRPGTLFSPFFVVNDTFPS